MLFVKKIFNRLLGKSPNRSKSVDRNLCKSDQNSLSSNSTSKLSNSFEMPLGKRPNHPKTIGELPNDRYSIQSPESSYKFDNSKSQPLPCLISLADARKNLHEINSNSAKGPENKIPRLKSYLLNSKQVPHNDIKAPKSSRQIPEIRRKFKNPNKSSQLLTDRNTPNSNNLSWSKDLSKSKSNLSSSFEDKPSLSPMRSKPQSNDLRQPVRQKDSSESPRLGNNLALKRVFPRSESYVQKNRQNSAKATKSIELLDNNISHVKTQGPSASAKQRQPMRQNSASQNIRYISQPPSKPKQLPAQIKPDMSTRGSYSRKESPKLLSLTSRKARAETLTVKEKTQSTAKERNTSSLRKIKNEEIVQVQQRPVAWKRYEIKSRELQQNTSTFENEMEKVDMLLIRSSNAMADLVSIRENLMELSFKEEMKKQKTQRKPHRPIRVPQ